MDKNEPLLVKRLGDGISITVGFQTVLDTCGEVPNIVGGGVKEPGMFEVTDFSGFLDDVIRQLCREAEDGTTRVHHLFDKVLDSAIEDGSNAVSEVPDDSDD